MRRILVDQARRKQADKHGGGRMRVELPDDSAAHDARPDNLLALDEALTRLERHDADMARLVKLRYFAGLSHQEATERWASAGAPLTAFGRSAVPGCSVNCQNSRHFLRASRPHFSH